MIGDQKRATTKGLFDRAYGGGFTGMAPVRGGELNVAMDVFAECGDDFIDRVARHLLTIRTKGGVVVVGELYQAALDMLRREYIDAGQAWALMLLHLQGSPSFEELPNIVQIAGSEVGWKALYTMTYDSTGALRSLFVRFFDDARDRLARENLDLMIETGKAADEDMHVDVITPHAQGVGQ